LRRAPLAFRAYRRQTFRDPDWGRVADSDAIRGEPGERTINGLNAIVKRTEREGSGV
jgi:hypothetical protein